MDNPLVTGAPFIRFYAGAALIVEDVKVRNRNSKPDDNLNTSVNITQIISSIPTPTNLVLKKIQIGTLCIADKDPRPFFSQKDALNLRDIAEAVSNIIRERRDKILRNRQENARM